MPQENNHQAPSPESGIEQCQPTIFYDPSHEIEAYLEGVIEMSTLTDTARHPLQEFSTFGVAGVPIRRSGMIVNPITQPVGEGAIKNADAIALPTLDNEYNGALTATINAYRDKLLTKTSATDKDPYRRTFDN